MEKIMKSFNIYLCGVGGQGIGLLSEILLRGADYAGYKAKAVDTHGLAQRGGIVISHLRLGAEVYSPMVSAGKADLVVALERHEALRASEIALREGGTLIYFDTVLQPLGVRMGRDKEVSESFLLDCCATRDISVHKVEGKDLPDPRMQNIAVLAHIHIKELLPHVTKDHLIKAMNDLMSGTMLQRNLDLFNSF